MAGKMSCARSAGTAHAQASIGASLRLQAYVTAERHQALRADYEADLKAAVEANVPA
jgi:hypothetical protein